MPLFVIEREFTDGFEPDDDELRLVDSYNADHDLTWLTSFLSADKKKTYCLYECADIDTLRRHAADLGLPADTITEVTEFTRSPFPVAAAATASGPDRHGPHTASRR